MIDKYEHQAEFKSFRHPACIFTRIHFFITDHISFSKYWIDRQSFPDFDTKTMSVDGYLKKRKLDSIEAKKLRDLIKSLKDLEGPK